MIREIIKNESFLSQRAEPATAEDLSAGLDLLETLKAHKHECTGRLPVPFLDLQVKTPEFH